MIRYTLLLFISFCCMACSKLDKELERAINSISIDFLCQESEYLILFGDIQHYTESNADIEYYKATLKWINKAHDMGYSIKAVLHTGDLTQDNTSQQWERFDKAIRVLNPSIPWISAIGNHDYEQNSGTRSSQFNQYVDYLSNPYFGGSFAPNNTENAFFKFRIHNNPFFLITLEFGVRDKTLIWADSIARSDTQASGIILTHAHLFRCGEIYEKDRKGQNVLPWDFGMNKGTHINDGMEVWNKLISPNNCIRMVICGHKTVPHWNAFSLFPNNNGNRVLNLLFNPEDHPKGGDGWLTILEFKKETREIQSIIYSPILNAFHPITVTDGETDRFIFNY